MDEEGQKYKELAESRKEIVAKLLEEQEQLRIRNFELMQANGDQVKYKEDAMEILERAKEISKILNVSKIAYINNFHL